MFVKLIGGNRVFNLLGYSEAQPESGKEIGYRFGDAYDFIELPLFDAFLENGDGDYTACPRELTPGMRVLLVAKGTINPGTGYHGVLSFNRALARVGSLSYQSIISRGDNSPIGVAVDVKQSFNLDNLPWLVRVYLAD